MAFIATAPKPAKKSGMKKFMKMLGCVDSPLETTFYQDPMPATRDACTEITPQSPKRTLRRIPGGVNLKDRSTDIYPEEDQAARRARRRRQYLCGGSSLDTASTVRTAEISAYSDTDDEGSTASSLTGTASTRTTTSSSSAISNSYKQLAKRRMKQSRADTDMKVIALL